MTEPKTAKDLAAREAALAAREAEVANTESNQAKLANGEGHASATLDHGLQEARLRCPDQVCPNHWVFRPVKVRVEELVRFMDTSNPGSGSHAFNNVVLSSNKFYYPESDTKCQCGKECVLIPPGGQSCFEDETAERIAEAGPGLADNAKSRVERIKQMKEHERLIKEMQASSETTEKAFNSMYDRAKEGK